MAEIRRIEIEPAENGGHTVTHHFKEKPSTGRGDSPMSYTPSENHVFGAGDGHGMLAHVANALHISAEGGKGLSSDQADKIRMKAGGK